MPQFSPFDASLSFATAPPAPATAQAAPQGEPAAVTEEPAGDDKPQTAAAPVPPPPAPAAPAPAPAPPVVRNLEFHTDTWGEAYSRRIDETIAALKTSDVPVFWVGLPPLRGQKASADMAYLNDLYRSRAEKAGITYVDTWDGFELPDLAQLLQNDAAKIGLKLKPNVTPAGTYYGDAVFGKSPWLDSTIGGCNSVIL